MNRGHGEDGTEEEKYDVEEVKREIEEYVRFVQKNTEFFTTADPETLLGEIAGYFEEKGYTFAVAKDKYKIKGTILVDKEDPIDVTVKILKADKDKYCVEFTRTGGDQLQFFNQYAIIKDYFGDLVDASY